MKREKLDMVMEVSDPFRVARRLKRHYGKNAPTLYISHNKTKKYMIHHPETNKKINFGSIYYEDCRLKFMLRNDKWKDADIYSPAYLSYWLLW